MLDNQLITLIIKTITDQEVVAGIPNTPIAQAFQPTQQGVNTQATGFIHKLFDHRLGSPYRSDVYNTTTKKMVHTEVQEYETTFQIGVLSTQDPANQSQYTASDIANLIAYILQSSATIDILNTQGVGVLRSPDVRNPFFTDDRDRNEAAPSFDFTVQHKQIVTSAGLVVESIGFNIVPI